MFGSELLLASLWPFSSRAVNCIAVLSILSRCEKCRLRATLSVLVSIAREEGIRVEPKQHQGRQASSDKGQGHVC